MVVELVLTFRDEYLDAENHTQTSDIVHTLNTPEGFELTGGTIFIENSYTSDLKRFTFRVGRLEDGSATLEVLESARV